MQPTVQTINESGVVKLDLDEAGSRRVGAGQHRVHRHALNPGVHERGIGKAVVGERLGEAQVRPVVPAGRSLEAPAVAS